MIAVGFVGGIMSAAIKVLLVDDDPNDQTIMEDILSDHKKFQFLGACQNFEELKKVLIQDTPDILLIDVFFHGEKMGHEILRYVRQQIPFLKAIMLTSHEKEIADCYRLGA